MAAPNLAKPKKPKSSRKIPYFPSFCQTPRNDILTIAVPPTQFKFTRYNIERNLTVYINDKEQPMINKDKDSSITEKLREVFEQVGQGLEQLLNPNKPQPQVAPIPVPVDQRPRRR